MKQANYDKMKQQITAHFEEEFKASENYKPTVAETKDPKFKGSRSLTHKWASMDFSQNGKEPIDTGFNKEKLINIATSSVEVSPGIEAHSRI